MSDEALAPLHCQQPKACHIDGWGPNPSEDSHCKVVGECGLCGRKLCDFGVAGFHSKIHVLNPKIIESPHCDICIEALIETELEFNKVSLSMEDGG